MVECLLAKQDVTGSSPVRRSILTQNRYTDPSPRLFGGAQDQIYFVNLRRNNDMRIMEFLSEKAITADLKSTEKEDILKELVDLLVEAGEIDKKDKGKLIEQLMAREALGSTAIGQGVGIPHTKSGCVTKLVASFGLSQKGVDFDSLDGEKVYVFFLLVAPQDSAGPHLKALARISRLLKDKYFRETLKECKDEKTILKTIFQEDEKKL